MASASPKEQEHPRAHHAAVGERELVGDQHRHYGQRQRHYRPSPPLPRVSAMQTQPPFDGAQILGQAIQRFHAASLSTERC